jgi:hypothetical protein
MVITPGYISHHNTTRYLIRGFAIKNRGFGNQSGHFVKIPLTVYTVMEANKGQSAVPAALAGASRAKYCIPCRLSGHMTHSKQREEKED